jgi:hypothetical protein
MRNSWHRVGGGDRDRKFADRVPGCCSATIAPQLTPREFE